ncbi:MAG: hypothetical protein ACQEQ7_09775 [Thermodesulfobacteriota bacterium]
MNSMPRELTWRFSMACRETHGTQQTNMKSSTAFLPDLVDVHLMADASVSNHFRTVLIPRYLPEPALPDEG